MWVTSDGTIVGKNRHTAHQREEQQHLSTPAGADEGEQQVRQEFIDRFPWGSFLWDKGVFWDAGLEPEVGKGMQGGEVWGATTLGLSPSEPSARSRDTVQAAQSDEDAQFPPWVYAHDNACICANKYAEVTAHYRHVKHPCVVCGRAFRCTFSERGKSLGEADMHRCINDAEQQWQRYKRLRLEATVAAQCEKKRRDRAQFIPDTLNEISSDKVIRIDLQALTNIAHLLQFRDDDRPNPANPQDALCVRALTYSERYPEHPVMAKFDGTPLQLAAIRWEDETVTICIQCMRHLTRPTVKMCPRLSLANGLWRGPMDCKEVKIVTERTEGELLLVLKAILFHCIYKLYPAGDGSGVVLDADRQLAVFGTVFVVPQDIDRLHHEIQTILPRDVHQMSRYMRIVYIRPNEKADSNFIKRHARHMLGVDGSTITPLMEFLQGNCYRYAEDEVWVDPKRVIKLPQLSASGGDAASHREVPRPWLEFAAESDLFEENLAGRHHQSATQRHGDDLAPSERTRRAMQEFTHFGGCREQEEDGDDCLMNDASSIVKTVLCGVPGSSGAKEYARQQILYYIVRFGLPVLFSTRNFYDLESTLRLQLGVLSKEQVFDLNECPPLNKHIQRCRQMAARNPAAAAEMFNICVRAFLACLLRRPLDLRPGVSGKCKASIGPSESQGRGILYFHHLDFLEGAPSPRELRKKMTDRQFCHELEQWLDSTIHEDVHEFELHTKLTPEQHAVLDVKSLWYGRVSLGFEMHFEDVERLLDAAKNAPVPSLHVEDDMRSVNDEVSIKGDDGFWAPQLESDDDGEPLSVKSYGSVSSCVESSTPSETMDEFVGPADDEHVIGFPKVASKAVEAEDAFLSDPDPKRLFEPLTTTQKKQLVIKLYYPGHETSDNSTMDVDPWLDVEQSKEYVDPATFIGRIFLADSKDSGYLNLQFSRRFMAVACRSLLHSKKHTMSYIKKSNKFKWQQVMRKIKRLMGDYNSRLRDLAKAETANNDALRREALNLKEEANKLSALIPCRLSMPKKMIYMTITITKCGIIRLRRHHR
ncbi:unnamed protein product [Vitrella brassicaformis CCMP3155]|uniref:Uncharacterized protein n=1 Tax=Vitrella brassicaformis (strain CCMP3155) TaxID=1169540 RepID=A0A0G4EYF1_VITBC|nr:unnamed protein product [Vitrella brassicaformis CCMP3155]|eukprot:CEM04063.1 unnamed protein product [Vitrella brassicaformis CCMP3155]